MSGRYDGPVIDAHHHLWDISLGRHPWMTDPDSPLKALGNTDFMRRDYLVADYLADAGPQPIAGTVFVEAVWDRSRPVDEEIRWLESLDCPGGIAARRIGWVNLASPDVETAMDRLGALRGFAGVRETIRWHPDPAKNWARAGILDDPTWRRGAKVLQARGLILEVLMNPYQSADVSRLAADIPNLAIVVNHCASPMDRDAEGLARWRDGLHAMAVHPNVAIKLSNFAAYATDHTPAALKAFVMTCVEAFTPARAMFATDYPIGRRAMSFQDICTHFRNIIEPLSLAEQRMLLHDTAARLYDFDL